MDPPEWYSQEMKKGYVRAQRKKITKTRLRKLTRPIRNLFRRIR